MPTATKVERLLVDLGHVPVFALIALLLLKVTRRAFRSESAVPARRDYLVTALAVSALAVASEGLQLVDAHRVVSVSDALRNGAGGALGLLLCALYYRPPARRMQGRAAAVLITVAVVLVLALLFPLAWTSLGYLHKRASWPIVLGANHWLELPYSVAYESKLQVVRLPTDRPGRGREAALRLRVPGCEQCGILVQELTGDWNGLTKVCLEMTNPGRTDMRLSVQLGDAPMFFRSSLFHRSAISVPSRSRSSYCLPIVDTEPAGRPLPDGIEYRSLALLTVTDEPADIVIHRVRLQ